VQQGTTREQRVIAGTLANLPERARAAGLTPPTLVIVGPVVALADALSWFAPGHGTPADSRAERRLAAAPA
jgi:uroporphyrin-III C-methyltransferase/precorrin-2 dehydrogenase/sirohydrochlorin ferrochelatase